MNDLETRVASCFEAVFPTLAAGEIRRASQASVAEWDSVAALTLVNVIEEEFDIQISADAMPDLTSFDLIVEHLAGTANEPA